MTTIDDILLGITISVGSAAVIAIWNVVSKFTKKIARYDEIAKQHGPLMKAVNRNTRLIVLLVRVICLLAEDRKDASYGSEVKALIRNLERVTEGLISIEEMSAQDKSNDVD